MVESLFSASLAWSWPWQWSWDDLWQTIQQLVLAVADWMVDTFVWVLSQVPDPPHVDWGPYSVYLNWANAFVPFEVIGYALGWYLSWVMIWSVFRIIAKLIWSG